MEIAGRVVKAPFGTGSKSERLAVWLVADDGAQYVLRRAGASAYQDPELEQWLGRRVICQGNITGYTMLAERIEPAD